LLDERAESIDIEPPGELGDGIEFVLTRNGVREHHQVKRQTTRGSGWSIATLDASGVLKHIPRKLGGDNGEFHFVSSMGAPDLDEFSTNARQAPDFAAFKASFLGAKRRIDRWSDLTTRWQPCDEHECYDILRRTYIDTISEGVLRGQVLARISALVDGPNRGAANELVIIALDSVNALLTPDKLWCQLHAASLPRRTWANDPHALKALDDNNQRFLSSRKREFFRALFPQPLADEIGDNLRSADAKHGLITAVAGGGKSGLLVQLIEGLERDQIPYLAVRLDRLDQTLQTTVQIGKKLDLPGSPVPLLAAIAQGRRSVLVLDQLDAISLISGKNPDLFDPVCDLLDEVGAFPEMRVVTACRAFDLDNDHRLKSLAADPMFVRRPLKPLAREYVLQGVGEAGFDPARLSEKQIEVLSNPLSLSILAEIRPPSPRPVDIDTSIELFEAFWKRKQRDVEQRGVTPEQFNEAIDNLCQLLEQKGSLFIPEPFFCHDAAERLASAHVLTLSDQQWGFFHESFYDFANARRLYRTGKSLIEYLKERGQGIELRNQLRQSLALRRAADLHRYCKDVRDLLTDSAIRYHLKSATVAFLRGLADPSDAEWKLVEPLIEAAPGSDLGSALFCLVGFIPAWFDLAREAGAVRRWLESPDLVLRNLLAWALVQMGHRNPDEVVPILQVACAAGLDGQRFAAGVLSHSDLTARRPIFDLYLTLLGEGRFQEGDNRRGAPWRHLYSIVTTKPEWTCEALGVLLRNAVKTAASRGIPNPFSDEVGIFEDHQLDEHVIQPAYQAAPITFFQQIWQSIVTIVATTLERDRKTKPPYRDSVWRYRQAQFNHSVHDKLLRGVEAGIRAVAVSDFETFSVIVGKVSVLHATTIECLLVQGYAAAAQQHPDEALSFLLSDTSRLHVGPIDDPGGPAQELIRGASLVCSEKALTSLGAVLMDYYSAWEGTAEGLHARGHSQYRLLSSIPAERRSEKVTLRLQELERHFGLLEVAPSPSLAGEAVGGPITSDAADAMTDDQWLASMAKCSSSCLIVLPDGSTNSGALGLAQELQRVASNDRDRFGRFIERIPKTANPAYFQAIIMALADESVPAEMALAACRVAQQLEGDAVGQWIPYCLGKIALKDLLPEAVTMVCAYIGPTSPEYVRNSAYSTLASFLRTDRRMIELALPSLDLSAQQVPRALRSFFCCTLTPFFGTPFQQRVTDLFRPMWSLDPWLPADPFVEQFLNFAFRLEYKQFTEVMGVLLNCGDAEIEVMASRQATITALVVPDAADILSKLISGDQYARRGLAEVCAASIRLGQFRDRCTEHLMMLFSDPEPAVRAAASGCFDSFADEDLTSFWNLVTAFLDSPSAETYIRSLLDSLARSTVRHDALTLRACDRAIEQAIRNKDTASLELQLCRDLVLRTYHQSAEPGIRERSLDLIDRLLGLEVVGLEGALLEIEARR